MYKCFIMKSKKAVLKRFVKSSSNKVSHRPSCSGHLLRNKSKRRNSKLKLVSSADFRRIFVLLG
uniref:Ribosomal protein L35 n=1 Tax=Ophirina amphinema TaxID=2108040 RepID=A0A348AYS3_9EUKA|nr:ribosomal protein L35 [Ophirina amphinema]